MLLMALGCMVFPGELYFTYKFFRQVFSKLLIVILNLLSYILL